MSLAYSFLKPLVEDLTSPSFLFVWRASPAQAALVIATQEKELFFDYCFSPEDNRSLFLITSGMRKHCDDINRQRYSRLVLFTFIEY